MSVYLGNVRVGLAQLDSNNVDTAVEKIPIVNSWTRPSGWPDLDSLNLEMSGEESFIYMTFRTGLHDSIFSYHVDTPGSSYSVTTEIGHISSGSFIADTTYTDANGSNRSILFDDSSGYSDGYVVIRLTGRIVRFYLTNYTDSSTTIPFRKQPVLERIAYIPQFTRFTTSSSTVDTHGWGTYHIERDVINNGNGSALVSAYGAYKDCTSLVSLDVSGLKTQNSTNFTYMFVNCRSVIKLDVENFDVRKSTSFQYMFNNCANITSLDLRNWKTTTALTSITYMFSGCASLLEILGLENINTTNTTSFAYLFYQDRSIRDVSGIEEWNTAKVTSLANMFYECRNIQHLDLSGWDMHLVTSTSSTFLSCASLRTIDYPKIATSANNTSVASMFFGCSSLRTIDCSWIDLSGGKCTNMGSMFKGCGCVKELNIPSDWDLSAVTGSSAASSIFENCYALKTITGISAWTFTKYSYALNYIFSNCYALDNLDVSGWSFPKTTSLAYMFAGCFSLKSLNLSNWTIPSTVTSFASMFENCYSLTTIGNVSGWSTTNVTSMAAMFRNCMSMRTLPAIGSWNFSKVTTIANMFYNMLNLREVNLPNLALTKCTTVATAFRYCNSLEKVNLTGWTFPALTNTAPAQFLGDCPSLRVLIGPPAFTLNHSYNADLSLDRESLIGILNNLPTVATARTLNLSTQNINRLTTDEKAIATNKNWTLAN